MRLVTNVKKNKSPEKFVVNTPATIYNLHIQTKSLHL